MDLGNPELKAAYENAVNSKAYESVLKIAHTEEKAYATNNPQEYFAEATEAFFGTNDFYPVRALRAAGMTRRAMTCSRSSGAKKAIGPSSSIVPGGDGTSVLHPIAGSAGGRVSRTKAERRDTVRRISFSTPAIGQCSRRTSPPLTTTNGQGGASVHVPLFT